ncbi:hypothetical protein SEA_CULVER_59 [Gordonia phage Culver]|nr:hypothetical protein SEA_CULVER_59 [Gordonia phage Culver]
MTQCGITIDTDDGSHTCVLDSAHLSDPESITHLTEDGVRWSCVFDK